MLLIADRDALTIVRHGQIDVRRSPLERNGDASVSPAVFLSIPDQITYDATKPLCVNCHEDRLRRQAQVQRLTACLDQRFEHLNRSRDHIPHVDVGPVELYAARLQPRDLEQVVDQACELVGGEVNIAEQPMQRGRCPLWLVGQNHANGSLDCRDWCAEIV